MGSPGVRFRRVNPASYADLSMSGRRFVFAEARAARNAWQRSFVDEVTFHRDSAKDALLVGAPQEFVLWCPLPLSSMEGV